MTMEKQNIHKEIYSSCGVLWCRRGRRWESEIGGHMFRKKMLSWSPRIPWRWGSSSETSDLPSRLHDCHRVENTNMNLHSQKTTTNGRILQLAKQMWEGQMLYVNKTNQQIQEFRMVSQCNLQATQMLLHVATLLRKVKRHHISAETGTPPPPNYDTHGQVM
jgi:hypothetical protein